MAEDKERAPRSKFSGVCEDMAADFRLRRELGAADPKEPTRRIVRDHDGSIWQVELVQLKDTEPVPGEVSRSADDTSA